MEDETSTTKGYATASDLVLGENSGEKDGDATQQVAETTRTMANSSSCAMNVPPANKKAKIAENNDDDDDINAAKTSPSSRSSRVKTNDFFRRIPKKKRTRLEDLEHCGGDEEGENECEEEMPMDVSLSQLKRDVLGRDLKVDNDGHDWEEDEEDAEIRQIRALMNPIYPTSTTAAAGVSATAKKDSVENSKSFSRTDNIDSENDSSPSSSYSSLARKLRKDMICAICHEIVYPPVALLCGHSFCKPCIDWWLDHDKAGRCPTCRQAVFPNHHDDNNDRHFSARITSPNLALRACIMSLFGPEIVVRLQNRKRLRPRGERGGAHDAGYQILSELQEETWHYVTVGTRTTAAAASNINSGIGAAGEGFVQVRRNIVLDAEDQRMQLALAVYQKPMKHLQSRDDDDEVSGCFDVTITLLTMEEDEAADSGFPTNITTPEDELLICGHESSRFLYSTMDVQMKDHDGLISPLARLSPDANGYFKYTLDPSRSAGCPADTRVLLFEHSETGSQMEIDLAQLQTRAGGSTLLPNRQPKHRPHGHDGFVMGRYGDESDEEAENQDEFEDDGFVLGENDESDMEGAFSDEDEDDICAVCKDGGELMICDGGDMNDGCGKSFHAECVGRSAIPEGDWICQTCAQSGGIEADRTGHEYPLPAEQETSDVADVAEAAKINDGDIHENQEDQGGSLQQDKDCEETPVVKPSGRVSNDNNKRRFVLEDSDSD